MRFMSMQGFITSIDDFWTNPDEEGLGCYKIMSLEDSYGSVVNFVVAPTTYFVDHVMLRVGDLVSSDNQLKLNTDPQTSTVLENGQSFTNNPANRNLIVIYGATTRSIPAQTTPYKIIVMC